jgi:gliding motility-associated-like protein
VPIYGKSAMGLPYVLPFFEIKIQVANTCFIDETEFSLNTNASNITVLWDFGDGATSSENNSTHIYSLAGNYVVTAQVTVDGVVKIITKEITITTAPVANVIEDVFICDDVLNDGIEIFNLNDLNQDILGIQTGLIITYHLTQNDATLNRDSLNTMFENTTNPQQLFVRVESEINPKCFDTTSFDISITETPELELQDVFYICKNESVEIIVEGDFDSYIWSTGENTSSIIVNEAGIYNVTVSNNNLPQSTTTCSATKSFTVLQSDIPSSINFEVVDFSQNNRITVIVEGEGNYEYSINGFNYQDNSTFENLTESEYTVYVRDKRGCGIVSEEVFLLSQPKFFTPNGDGINDYWQIKSSFTEPEIDIQIFDRYGKLLLSFTGNSIGWDGNFNGQKLPTNDYWFVIKRPSNDKTYRGHFTLKR